MFTTTLKNGMSMRYALLTIATIAAMMTIPAVAGAAPVLGVAVTHAPAETPPYAPTPVGRDDSGFTYKFSFTNSGTAASPGDPPVSVSITLPPGVVTSALGGDGWACDQNALMCNTSAAAATGEAFPPVTMRVVLGTAPSDELTAAATISGGGSPGSATGHDTFTLAPPRPFGANTFTTSVVDAHGADLTQAGGHPFAASTSFNINSFVSAPSGGATPLEPVEDPKTIDLKLPPGFIGNPQAVPACESSNLASVSCPVSTQIGVATVDVLGSPGLSAIYNIKPAKGYPAEFGLVAHNAGPVFLFAKVRSDGDYGITIHTPYSSQASLVSASFTFWGVPADPAHDAQRCQPGFSFCLGGATSSAPRLPFLVNPTECSTTPPVTTLTIDSWQHPGVFVSSQAASPLVTGCDGLKFAPSISVTPDVTQADTPTAYSVHVGVPQTNDFDTLATPSLRDAAVTLPVGVSLSPGTADGLGGCTDAEIGLHSLGAAMCPDSSKIGTVHIASPLLASQDTDYLPDGPGGTHYQLSGSIYVRQPDPGADRKSLYAMFLDIEDPQTGIVVKLKGSVVPDPVTGQLTTTFKDNPQLPFTDFLLQFKGGSRAPLTNSPTCGIATTTSTFTSWGGPTATPSDSFAVNAGANGGACAASVNDLPFGPAFSAGLDNSRAGASSLFSLRFTRQDGEQDLGSIDASLPAGLLADIGAVPRCPEAQAAAGTCSAASQIGTTTVGAGAGATPLFVPQAGKAPTAVYLAGPYKGAPFSLSIVVPAQAGPFDLGTVVVRAALFVDRNDAHVTVKSDPLPTILEGTPLRIRDVRVTIDRSGFMRSASNCDPAAVAADITSAVGKSAHVSSPFQVSDCAALPFVPKLALKLTDKTQTKDGGHPGVVASLTQRNGEAAVKSASVTLPLSLALDPDNANGLCEFTDGLRNACPASSVVGTAKAVSPILDQPLSGPVYFVKGVRQGKDGRLIKTLPTLLVELTGENGLRIDLRATTDVDSQGRLVTTFPAVPDAPVSQFVLNITGGKSGIVVVTDGKDVCKDSEKPFLAAIGQNGKREDTRVTLTPECRVAVARTFTSKSVHARITGIGAGTVTVSGTGVRTAKRTIKSATSATVIAKLTAKGKRMRKAGRDIRLKVSYVPKGAKKAVVAYSTAPKKAKKVVAKKNVV